MAENPASRRYGTFLSRVGAICVLAGLVLLSVWATRFSPNVADAALAATQGSPAVASDESAETLRIAGTVEAVRTLSVRAPRMRGAPSEAPLVVTKLVPGGTRVEVGDVLAEFDRQDQERTARDRRSEFLDLEGQIRQLQAEHAAARATDLADLTVAESDIERARLDVTTNPLLPRVDAEKNDLALEEATARAAQLRTTLALKRKAANAELRILEIQRDRALSAARDAERNAALMVVRAEFSGLVVLQSVWRQGRLAEVQESEEVRPGVAILDVVDASAMQVRARVNQADITHVSVGRPVKVRLDAYPDLVFKGRVEQVAPLAVPSALTPRVRTFTVVVSIDGSHELLMPDLSAAVDLTVARSAG